MASQGVQTRPSSSGDMASQGVQTRPLSSGDMASQGGQTRPLSSGTRKKVWGKGSHDYIPHFCPELTRRPAGSSVKIFECYSAYTNTNPDHALNITQKILIPS